MLRPILFLLVLLCGTDEGYADEILKLRFVSPPTSVTSCGNIYDIRSTCLPIVFSEAPRPKYPHDSLVDPPVSADILRRKPEVQITDNGRDPSPSETYCLLMGNIGRKTAFSAPLPAPYINWLVCDIPGNRISEGRELVPYSFTPVRDTNARATPGVEQVKFWLFRAQSPFEDYQLWPFTFTDCGISNRCMFQLSAFAKHYALTEVYSATLSVSISLWSANQVFDGEQVDCVAIPGLVEVAAAGPLDENYLDDGYRPFCSPPVRVCNEKKTGCSCRHPATSWGLKYIPSVYRGILTN